MKLLLKIVVLIVVNHPLVCKEFFMIGLMLDLLLFFIENREIFCCNLISIIVAKSFFRCD
jgi:hypothetical protein